MNQNLRNVVWQEFKRLFRNTMAEKNLKSVQLLPAAELIQSQIASSVNWEAKSLYWEQRHVRH